MLLCSWFFTLTFTLNWLILIEIKYEVIMANKIELSEFFK